MTPRFPGYPGVRGNPQLGEAGLIFEEAPRVWGETLRVQEYPHTGQEGLGVLPDVRVLLGCQQVGDQDSASHHGEPPKTGRGQEALRWTGMCWGLLRATGALLAPTEAIQGLSGDYWVLVDIRLGLQGPYWDLVDATGIYCVSVGVYWGPTGALWSLLASIGCLLQFTDAVLGSTGATLGHNRIYWGSTGILGGICCALVGIDLCLLGP